MLIKMYSLSIILPVYNEENNIGVVIGKIIDFISQNKNLFKHYEVIIVNDGSKDNTVKVLKEFASKIPYLKVVTHHKNRGYGVALSSGFKNANFSCVLFMDADGQFDIWEFKKFLPYLDNYDIIVGYRYKRKDNLYRILLGKIYGYVVFLIFGVRFKDVNCGLKLFKRKALEEEIYSTRGIFYTEVLLKAKKEAIESKKSL